MPNPYGLSISLDNAKKVAAPGSRRGGEEQLDHGGRRCGYGGNPGLLRRSRITPKSAAPNVAIEKARSATLFKRPTKAFQETLAAGADGLRVLHLRERCG